MKKSVFLSGFLASALSLVYAADQASPAVHVHEDGTECTGNHEEPATHVHEDGTECSGNHEEPATHVHEDGTECSDNHDEPATHVHEDGTECSGDHAGEAAADECGAECTGDHGPSEKDDHDHAPGEVCTAGGGEVIFTITDKAQKSLALVYGTPVKGDIASGQVVYGQLEVPPSSILQYAALSKGLVTLMVKPGQDVKVGQDLYSIVSPEITSLLTEMKNAELDTKRLEAEVGNLQHRQKNLSDINVRNAELESQIVAKQNEVLLLKSKQEQTHKMLDRMINGMGVLNDEVLTVKAKFEGEVGDIPINQGAWLEQGQPIMNIIPTKSLEFKGAVYAGDDLSNMTGKLEFALNNKQYQFDGKLRVAPEVNAESRTKAVYFIPNKTLPEQAFIGQRAKLVLTGSQDASGYLNVPQGAVIKVGVEDVVFVKIKEKSDSFAMIKVQTLPSYQGMVPVKGLHANDQIVVEGGNELKYAIPTGDGQQPKKSAGHFHADGKFHEGEH